MRSIYISILLGMALPALAAERVDRYTVLSNTATPEQMMPLNQVTTIRLTGDIETGVIGILAGTGFQLLVDPGAEALTALLSKPIPVPARHFERVRIINALHAIAGPAFNVLVDPVNRLVSFEVKPDYRTPSQTAVPAQRGDNSGV